MRLLYEECSLISGGKDIYVFRVDSAKFELGLFETNSDKIILI